MINSVFVTPKRGVPVDFQPSGKYESSNLFTELMGPLVLQVQSECEQDSKVCKKTIDNIAIKTNHNQVSFENPEITNNKSN